jgi:hypothetical protein
MVTLSPGAQVRAQIGALGTVEALFTGSDS